MKLHLIISAALALLFAVPVVSADYPTVEVDFDSADLDSADLDSADLDSADLDSADLDLQDEAFWNDRWSDRAACFGRSRSSCRNSSRCSWSSNRRVCRPNSSGGGNGGSARCSGRSYRQCTNRCRWRNGRCQSRMSSFRPNCSTSSRTRCRDTRGCRWMFRSNHRNGGVCRPRNFDEEYDLE